MSRICVATSPLNCRWIIRGSEVRLGDYVYAVCQRMRTRDRLVNEADCARCPLWLEPEAYPDHHEYARFSDTGG